MEDRQIKILAIDDILDNLISLKALICEAFPKAVVLLAQSGLQGIHLASVENPDVILLDIAMPQMDGFEVCRRIKADNGMRDIPIVFVTAVRVNKESRIHALECGAEAFLTKPIDELELTAQIRAMIKIRTANIEKRDQNKRLESMVREKTTALKKSEQLYKALFEYSGVGIGYYSSFGTVISLNRKAIEICGGNAEDYLGKTIYEQYLKEEAGLYFERIQRAMQIDKPNVYEDYVTVKAGSKWLESTFSRIADDNGVIIGVQIASLDITERKKAVQKLEYLSYHDQLTGLYNRRYFEESLLRYDTAENLPLSIIMADINGLKLINDSFGHTVGDELLTHTADILIKYFSNSEISARLGGDEFAILLPKSDSLQTTQIIDNIQAFISNIHVANVALSVSFGFDTKTMVSQSLQEVLVNAENGMYRHKLSERSSIRSKTIDIIMNTLFEKSNRELLHSRRVSEISEAIAQKMNLHHDVVDQIKIAGLLHDIGKIGIDEKILNKNSNLDQNERKEISKHPEIGWRILCSTNEFAEISNFILEHHEKWDGSGYPKGLVGENISIEARIIMAADAYDAMTNERSYRKGISREAAFEELRRCTGTHFDPAVVEVLLNECDVLT